ncbi:Uncharacterized protein HZ326_24518 [Fusarium oxysporum f. sp. albedinis]|nr:Uncharacterized protein HZ326_24518 [Fusarium oxysporum f. sp. albedinis]
MAAINHKNGCDKESVYRDQCPEEHTRTGKDVRLRRQQAERCQQRRANGVGHLSLVRVGVLVKEKWRALVTQEPGSPMCRGPIVALKIRSVPMRCAGARLRHLEDSSHEIVRGSRRDCRRRSHRRGLRLRKAQIEALLCTC